MASADVNEPLVPFVSLIFMLFLFTHSRARNVEMAPQGQRDAYYAVLKVAY